jgi:hypothetical protein
MTDKPLTKKDLQEVLDTTFEKYTEKVLKPTVINALHDFYQDILEPKFDTLTTEVKSLDIKLSKKIDENTYQIKQLNHKVEDVKTDLSDTPTRAEFEKHFKN